MKTKTAKKAAAPRKKSAPARSEKAEAADETRQTKALETVLNEVTAEPQATAHIEEWVSVECPYCGEDVEVHVTSEQDGQSMYEDCGVCCRPVSLFIQIEDGEIQVEASRS